MSDAAYETAHVAVLDQLRHAFADIIEEAHGVPQEVHGAQDLGRLADQLLHTEDAAESPSRTLSPEQHASAHLPEVLEDVVEDDLLRLVRVHPGERVHVDDSVFKSNQRKSQGSFQGLNAEKTKFNLGFEGKKKKIYKRHDVSFSCINREKTARPTCSCFSFHAFNLS